jgi:sulfite reductase (NADPH) flavoprotein alpha-component
MSLAVGGPAAWVLYGSETGNAEQVAKDLAAAIEGKGITVRLDMLDDVAPTQLPPATGPVLVVTSTYGDGDMPYNADRFWRALSDDGAPRLDGLHYAVLGLGDTGYFDFCNAAVLIDGRFDELGASRLWPLRKCDEDYYAETLTWTDEVVQLLVAMSGATPVAEPHSERPTEPRPAQPEWSQRHPYPATILHSHDLTGPGSLKQVRHLALSIAEDALGYQVGDSLGVVPNNEPALVDALLAALHSHGDEQLAGRPLHELLTSEYEISRPSRELVEEVRLRTDDPDMTQLLGGADRRALHEFLWARDVLDLLALATRAPLNAAELLGLLHPLAHRSYSISSSPLVTPGQADLAVATLRYRAGGRDRGGVCSTHLVDRLTGGDTARVFLVPNETFRPPAAPDTAMIMVGPGTGVAPFRAFLQHRRAQGARGRNWLFFGGRHRRCDHLYGDELTTMAADGLLTRLDLAFSRDQAEKIYVQDRMRENGRELYRWLADGAKFYVCGDAVHMADDVDRALHEIVAEHGGLTSDAAADYISALKREHRYVRDVY